MGDPDAGKLFIGGISKEITENALRDHFSKYGVVSSTTIAFDRVTGNRRGFGFVTFSDAFCVENALLDLPHVICGRTVEVKKAIPKNEQTNSQKHQQQQQQQYQQQQMPGQFHTQWNKGSTRNFNGTNGTNNIDQLSGVKKIFVGGLSASLTEEEFKGYFEKFGRITDVVVMHDNITNKPRGFGFITFDSEEVVEKIVQKSHHEVAGKYVEVKKAIPKELAKNSNNGYNNSRFGRGRFSPVAGYPDDNNYLVRSPTPGNYMGQVPVSPTYSGYYYGGMYGGGYPAGGYGVVGYGMPMVVPRIPWNGFGMTGVRPLAYGTGYYPTAVNGGVAMMGVVHPYSTMMEPPLAYGKPDQDVGSNGQVKDANSGRSAADVSGLKSGKVAVAVKKSSRIPEEQAPSS